MGLGWCGDVRGSGDLNGDLGGCLVFFWDLERNRGEGKGEVVSTCGNRKGVVYEGGEVGVGGGEREDEPTNLFHRSGDEVKRWQL